MINGISLFANVGIGETYFKENNMNRCALSYFNTRITYKEMFEKINVCAKALLEFGIKEGDIVSISLPSVPESAYLFYAISKIGAVANMIDPRTSSSEIERYVNETNSKLLFMVDVANAKIQNIMNNTNLEDVINVSPADSLSFPLKGGYKIKSFIENKKNNNLIQQKFTKWDTFYNKGIDSKIDFKQVEDIDNKPVLIVHTGGTTGTPKGVVLSNRNINAIPYQSEMFPTDLKVDHKWLNIMPPFIAYGIGTGLHFPLSLGMEDILIPAFDPNEFDKLLLKYKPNHISGVPSHWNNIINSKKLNKTDFSFLVSAAVGGDTMDRKLEEKSNEFLEKHNCKYRITKGYGMSELNGSVGRTLNDNNPLGSVGVPFVKTNIKICNPENGEELSYNQEGEIYITAPSMMIGYYNNQVETNNTKVSDECGDNWIKSGDIGYIKEDGNLFISDRIKRIIIRHDGFKVFPSAIEKVIDSHPNVSSCKVVGMPDVNNIQGELPCAYIILNDENIDYKEFEKSVFDLCKKMLPEYSQPSLIKLKKEFPLTPVGKIDALKLANEIKQEMQNQTKVLKK